MVGGDTKNERLKVSSNPAARQHVEGKGSGGIWPHVPVFINKPAGKACSKQKQRPALATVVHALGSSLASSIEQFI